jgi:hypothetical protein
MKQKIADGLFYLFASASLFLFILAADYTIYAICKDIFKLKITEIIFIIVGASMFTLWFLLRGFSMFTHQQKISDRS